VLSRSAIVPAPMLDFDFGWRSGSPPRYRPNAGAKNYSESRIPVVCAEGRAHQMTRKILIEVDLQTAAVISFALLPRSQFTPEMAYR